MERHYGRVLTLVEQIYGAASQDSLWPPVLEDLSQLLGGESLTLFFTDDRLRPIDKFFGHNVSPEAISSYQDHYHTVDIRMHRAIPDHIDNIVTDGDLVDQSIIEKHEFYQDFLRPIGHRYIVSAVLGLGDQTFAFCSSHRGLKQDHADQETRETAALLIPHLRRGLQLRRRLLGVEEAGLTALAVLDRLGQGVFLISDQGRIIWQNALASRILRQHDGLLTSEGELRGEAPLITGELTKLVKSAIHATRYPRAEPGGMMTVSRPSLKRAYQIFVAPLPRMPSSTLGASFRLATPMAAVFVTDPEVSTVPKAQMLTKLYNLTPAEARLATALAAGTSTKQYAEQARLSIHYVRWLLKQVEAKTDTRRIADLIRLLISQTIVFGDVPEDD